MTDEIIKDLAQLKQAGLVADGSAPTVVDSASIGSGIDSSTDIAAIKDLLTNILGELVNSKAFADVVVQDSVKTPFIRREEVDQTTGQRTIRIENFDGSLGAPVGAIVPIKNGGDSIIEDQYYAQAAGSGFSLGDSLSSLKVIDEARAVTLLGWFNITTQSVIAAPPTTAIKGYEDLVEELLSKLVSQLPASLGQKTAAQSLSVALSSDTTLPLPAGAATALNQEEEILVLEAIGSSLALAATESTLLDIENRLIAIETNTLAPSIRALDPATDGVTVESTVLATISKQDEQKVVLDSIDDKLALTATESTLLVTRDKLAAIEANTLISNSRPLTPAVDAVRVESATLATIAKQDEQKTVLTEIDQKLALASTAGLQAASIDKLDQILIQLSKSKEFEDLIVQDTAGTAFIRRELLDEGTNQRTITIENFDGSLGAPVGAVTTVKQVKGNNIVTRYYYAKVAGAGFAAGHSLSTMQIVNGETSAVTMLGWFNITTQASIAAPATTEIEGYEDLIQELLAKIVSQLPATLGAKPAAESLAVTLPTDLALPLPAGAATEVTSVAINEAIGILSDVSFPADEQSDSTLKGLIRLLAKYTATASVSELDALGRSADTDIAAAPIDFGSLKSVLRGEWADLAAILGGQNDASQSSPFDVGSIKSILRGMSKLLIDGSQFTMLRDGDGSGANAVVLPRTVRATEEAALVVAISPTTPLDINSLPASVEANIAAIRNNTANISRYQFNLAQTAAGVVFLVRTDTVTGLTTTVNLATGLPFAPGSIEMSDPTAVVATPSTKLIEPNEFSASTAVAGQWAIGDILTRVLVIDTATNTATTLWQGANGATLTTIPVLGTDVQDTDKIEIELLRSIATSNSNPNIRPLTAADIVTIANLPTNLATTTNQTVAIAQAVQTNARLTDRTQKTQISNGTIETAIVPAGAVGDLNTNALSVAIRPDSTVVVSALPGTIQGDIAAIRANTARISPYQFQLVEDATSTVFVARWDTVTGTVTNLTLGGSIYTPSGALDVVSSGSGSGLSLEINEFEAATTVAGQWTVGDLLTRVLAVNATTLVVAGTIWQSATGVTLTTIPVVGTDVIDTDKRQLALLKSIDSKNPVLGAAAIAASVPVTIASDQLVPVALVDRHIVGATAVHTAGVNTLSAVAGTTAAIDLSGYRSFSIQISSSLNIVNQWILEGSNDNINFLPVSCVDQASPNVVITGAVTYSPTPITYIGRRSFRYLRLRNLGTLAGGSTATAFTTLSPLDIVLPTSVGITPGTVVGNQLAPAVNIVDLSTTLTTQPSNGTASPTFSPTWGTAISFAYAVQISNAGSNLIVSVQESNNGSIWTNLHTWPTLSSTQAAAVFVDTSPMFAVTARFYRFVYGSITNAGGSWNITFSHNQSNNTPIILADSQIGSQLIMVSNNPSEALNVQGKGVASFAVSGTWTGNILAQVTGDGINWSSLNINNAVYSPVTKTFINNGNINANGIYEINCGGLKAVRLLSTITGSGTATVALRASNASSLVAIEGQVSAQISNTNLLVRSDSNAQSVDLNSTLTASATSITFNQTWGVSRLAEINVATMSAATTYTVEWQEPVGTGWRTAYKFPPITAAGVYRSPLLPNVNNSWRYLETIVGATPTVTRTITRTQSNLAVPQPLFSSFLGGFNFSDLAVPGQLRSVVANNNGTTKIFLQVHNKALALAPGDIPQAGRVYPVVAGGVVALTVADLGDLGSSWFPNTRLALSTTFSTWTSPAAVGTPNQTFSLNAEVV